MGGEDFGAFGRAGVPAFIFWLGAVEPDQARKAEKGGVSLPSLHSPLFAPAAAPTLRTGVISLTAIALDLFAAPAGSRVPTP
jgi:hippurate hydrolase